MVSFRPALHHWHHNWTVGSDVYFIQMDTQQYLWGKHSLESLCSSDQLQLTANPAFYPWMFSHVASGTLFMTFPELEHKLAMSKLFQLFHLFFCGIVCQLSILVGKVNCNNITQDYCDTSWLVWGSRESPTTHPAIRLNWNINLPL